MFTYVTLVVIATRAGEAGTVGASVEFGRLEREHIKDICDTDCS